MLILATIVAALTVFVLVLALSGTTSPVRSRLDTLRAGGQPPPPPPQEGLSLSARVFTPMFRGPVRVLNQALPRSMIEQIEQRLVLAGEPMTLSGYLTLQLLSVATFLALPLLLFTAGGGSVGPIQLIIIVAFIAVGIMLPGMWLKQRVAARQKLIIKGLPDAFDLITTCVEAGLGLDAALSRVSDKVEGPFGEELQRTLRDISLGRSRRVSLVELGTRTGVPDLVSFVNAVIQAEQMGSSVGTVLRVQSEQLRVRRRQRAEEQAYKAPVKMIFPLILCIFPTLFIVILGPAVITIMNDFPGS